MKWLSGTADTADHFELEFLTDFINNKCRRFCSVKNWIKIVLNDEEYIQHTYRVISVEKNHPVQSSGSILVQTST